MHIAQLPRSIFLATVIATVSTASFADCQSTKAATIADVGQGEALLKSMIDACTSGDAAGFFSLQTKDTARMLASNSPAQKEKQFANYCAFTKQAVKTLGGSTSGAVHSIGPDGNRMKCNAPASYWFVRSKSGELALRLEVGVESGRLKIDTH